MAYGKRAYVEHVAIRVRDIEWHIRFFRDVLGMTLRDDRRGETPSQVWTVGGVQLVADPAFDGPEGRLAHLGVMVEDVDAVLREAEALSLGPSIRFLGRREDVRDILMQCDLMALSSDTEQMPLAVLEAMDAGLPIASTDVGDVRQMVSGANQPYVVNLSDRELGAAMRALVIGAAARKTVGAANKDRLRRNYLAADMIAAYRKLMLETAGK